MGTAKVYGNRVVLELFYAKLDVLDQKEQAPISTPP